MQELSVCVFGRGPEDRIGSFAQERIYDLNLCCARKLSEAQGTSESYRLANTMVPPSLAEYIRGGDAVLSAARSALGWVLLAAGIVVGEA